MQHLSSQAEPPRSKIFAVGCCTTTDNAADRKLQVTARRAVPLASGTPCVTPCVILQQVVAPLGSRLKPGQSSGTGAPKVPPWSGQGTAGEGSISYIKNPAYSTPSAPWPRDPFTGGSCASMGLLMSALPKAAGMGHLKAAARLER